MLKACPYILKPEIQTSIFTGNKSHTRQNENQPHSYI